MVTLIKETDVRVESSSEHISSGQVLNYIQAPSPSPSLTIGDQICEWPNCDTNSAGAIYDLFVCPLPR